jgi:hypothetical protein
VITGKTYANILKQATNVENASSFGTSAFGALDQIGLAAGAATTFRDLGGRPPSGEAFIPPGSASATSTLPDTPSLEEQPPSILGSLGGLTKSNLGVVRSDWQGAYNALDQAISDAEIFSSKKVTDLARALRDRFRDDYYESVVRQLESLPKDKQPKDIPTLADALVGVPAPPPETYDPALRTKSVDELTEQLVNAAKEDLELNDR